MAAKRLAPASVADRRGMCNPRAISAVHDIMTDFLKWLAGVIARWLQPKEEQVTVSLTAAESQIASSVSTITAGATALGGDVGAFWKALEAAAAAKWVNIPFDAIAVDDLVILAAQIATDFSVPGAGTVLLIAKLLGGAIPESAALIQFIVAINSVTGVSIHGATPGASAADGGYPDYSSGTAHSGGH